MTEAGRAHLWWLMGLWAWRWGGVRDVAPIVKKQDSELLGLRGSWGSAEWPESPGSLCAPPLPPGSLLS